MSSSGCVSGSRRPSGSRLAMRWPRTRYMLMSECTCTTFSCCVRRVGERAAVGVPARRLVRHREAREDVVVEAVVAEQQVVDAAQELAALGAGDDAVVVGVGERGDLAHAELRERVRVGALVLGRVADAADAEDEPLPGHEPRHRVHGADHPRVRDRARWCRRSRRARSLPPRTFAISVLVRVPERRRSRACRRPSRSARAASACRRGACTSTASPRFTCWWRTTDGLAVLGCVRRVEVRGSRASARTHRVRDEVGEADLAARRCARAGC